MASIAFVGDVTTTTAVAVASGWPTSGIVAGGGEDAGPTRREVVVVECDPTGGSLAGWFDTGLSPSLSTAVARLHPVADADTGRRWATLEQLVRRSDRGPRFLPAPLRPSEVRGVVAEARRVLLPTLRAAPGVVALVDVGRPDTAPTEALAEVDLVVVVHRQEPASPGAATVRIERLAETFDRLADLAPALLLVGEEPFGLTEVAAHVGARSSAWSIAVDPLAAATLAGRRGVGARRHPRLPLMRTAAAVANDLERLVGERGPTTPVRGTVGRPAPRPAHRPTAGAER